jgi:hypothetical protein
MSRYRIVTGPTFLQESFASDALVRKVGEVLAANDRSESIARQTTGLAKELLNLPTTPLMLPRLDRARLAYRVIAAAKQASLGTSTVELRAP